MLERKFGPRLEIMRPLPRIVSLTSCGIYWPGACRRPITSLNLMFHNSGFITELHRIHGFKIFLKFIMIDFPGAIRDLRIPFHFPNNFVVSIIKSLYGNQTLIPRGVRGIDHLVQLLPTPHEHQPPPFPPNAGKICKCMQLGKPV